MREHVPSLLMRADALVRQGGQFYHSFVRMIEGGLFRLQRSLRSPHRWAGDQSSTEAPLDENEDRPAHERKRHISEEADSMCERRGFKNFPPYGAKLENKKLIVSVHIPKTGGTAFIEILKPIAQEILYL